jgi:multisubunit Na+/H+ antiporter MnhC subunit
VTSEPEVNAKFEFQGRTYTTPAIIACYPGTYFFAVKDISAKLEETPLLFTYVVYEASPPTQIFSATTTLNINSDANLTIVYASGFRREEWQPPPEEGEGLYCLPLIFYLIMGAVFIIGLYLFIQRETWKVSIPLVPIVLWLLIFQPKTPIDQMPLAFLRYFTVPPWHLYMAIILTIIACVALLSKKEK